MEGIPNQNASKSEPRKPSSPPSSDSSPHYPLRKRVLPPPMSTCDSCGEPSHPRRRLRFLPSQWRAALLCPQCLSAVNSAAICTYCFAPVSESEIFQNCLLCFRRVHLACIPFHRRYILPSQLDAESFACVDCCPAPKPRPPGSADDAYKKEERAPDPSR